MKFLLRVALKALLLFALINVVSVGTVMPGGRIPGAGQFSLYNHLFPGRPRFPFGEAPREAYNFSLYDLDAMFESHEVDPKKPAGEFRVVVLGDSSVWGTLLRPEETLTGQLNAYGLSAPDGRAVRFYNLGYPTLSLTKDLIIMDLALRHHNPDLVIWLTTLEAFPRDKQLTVPLVENNAVRARAMIRRFELDLDPNAVTPPNFWKRTLVGQRKNLADLARLQVYGIPWAATGIDQYYPDEYPPAQVDLEADGTFHGQSELIREDLAFEVLRAARLAARGLDIDFRKPVRDVPVLLVNEPILISSGANSDIRYNFYYPRRAYDTYRAWLAEAAAANGFTYLDAWDLVPPGEFTNSAIHVNRQGTGRLAEKVAEEVILLLE